MVRDIGFNIQIFVPVSSGVFCFRPYIFFSFKVIPECTNPFNFGPWYQSPLKKAHMWQIEDDMASNDDVSKMMFSHLVRGTKSKNKIAVGPNP
jgi:hypothetical protein